MLRWLNARASLPRHLTRHHPDVSGPRVIQQMGTGKNVRPAGVREDGNPLPRDKLDDIVNGCGIAKRANLDDLRRALRRFSCQSAQTQQALIEVVGCTRPSRELLIVTPRILDICCAPGHLEQPWQRADSVPISGCAAPSISQNGQRPLARRQ